MDHIIHYLLGCFGLLSAVLWGAFRLHFAIREKTSSTTPSALALLEACKTELGITNTVALIEMIRAFKQKSIAHAVVAGFMALGLATFTLTDATAKDKRAPKRKARPAKIRVADLKIDPKNQVIIRAKILDKLPALNVRGGKMAKLDTATTWIGNVTVDTGEDLAKIGVVKAPTIVTVSGQKAQLTQNGKVFEIGAEPDGISMQITPTIVEKGISIDFHAAIINENGAKQVVKAQGIVPKGQMFVIATNVPNKETGHTVFIMKVFQGSLKRLKKITNPKGAGDENGQIERFDANGDGIVDDKEAAEAAKNMLTRMESKGLRGEWLAFDANGDGILDTEETDQIHQEIQKRLKLSVTDVPAQKKKRKKVNAQDKTNKALVKKLNKEARGRTYKLKRIDMEGIN